MSEQEQARVRVLLVVGDRAEIVPDVPRALDAGPPDRYPAADVAEAVGARVEELPGMRLLADVGPDGRLSGFTRA